MTLTIVPLYIDFYGFEVYSYINDHGIFGFSDTCVRHMKDCEEDEKAEGRIKEPH